MRKVIDISSTSSPWIPDLEFLPMKGDVLTLKIKENKEPRIRIHTKITDQTYIVVTDDNAIYQLILTDCTLPEFLIRGTVKSITFLSYLEPKVTAKNFINELPPVKPENNPVVVNQKKYINTRPSLLQIINLFLGDTSNPFLDIDKLESIITQLDNCELDLLCNGRVFE